MAAPISHGEFGDLAMTIKVLLMQWEHLALSGGLMVTVPTARDTNVVLADGTPLVNIANHSTHLSPFLGFLWTPNDKFFMQGFYQVDVEAGGCPVSVNLDGTGLQQIGTLHDTTYQYIDLGMGSWLYRGHERFRRLTGWAWTLEAAWQRLAGGKLSSCRRQLADRRFQQLRHVGPDLRHSLGVPRPFGPDAGLC